MKKYILIENSQIRNKRGIIEILKGTELLSDGYIDEDGGIKCKIIKGTKKGMEIIFNIKELSECI